MMSNGGSISRRRRGIESGDTSQAPDQAADSTGRDLRDHRWQVTRMVTVFVTAQPVLEGRVRGQRCDHHGMGYILVLDDDPTVGRLVSTVLRFEGFAVKSETEG